MEISAIYDISLSDREDAGLEATDSKWTGKRQANHYLPTRKYRRVPLRSRNETIDNWLTLDNDEFGSAAGETYNCGDAFIDLEDFLVEG